ncbi:hypothetical protein D3C76_983720 [compost metagenome]
MQFVLRLGDLFRFAAGYAGGFGDIATEIPDPLAVGGRMGGDGDARLRSAAQAVGVQRLQGRRLDQHHVQRPALHGRLLKAEAVQQRLVAGAGHQDDTLGANLAAVDAQAEQFTAFR